jgi:DnaJ domain
MADPHVVLQVPRGSSLIDIKSAYRKLAKIYHPDISTGSEEKFKQITAAYDILVKISTPYTPSPQHPPQSSTTKANTTKPKQNQSIFKILTTEYSVVYCPDNLPEGTRVFFMDGAREFTVYFKEAMRLPFTIRVDRFIVKFELGDRYD